MKPEGLGWATAATIAFRDLAASRAKFLFIALAIAAGVGSLAGVRGFGRSFREMLAAEARTLMAADLTARVFELPNPKQIEAMDALAARGAVRTQVTETISMLTAPGEAPPALVSVKAVDPAWYPFYGGLELDPPQDLGSALRPDTIAVSSDILIRLPLTTGDVVRLGDGEFRIAAIVKVEPDRMAGSLNFGSRVLLSREALDRTGLVKPGSRAAQRHLFRLDPGQLSVAEARAEIRKILPSAFVVDYRETHPLITRGLERSERFLSLVGLIALIVGSMGVAATMHAHLRQRLDTIAIMKCLGARSGHVIRIYLIQTLAVGLAGGLAGVVLGALVQAAFPLLLERYLSVLPAYRFDWLASLEAVAIGLLTATLFTWPALLGVRRVRPAAIFRRDMADPSVSWRMRWFASPEVWVARGAVLAALAGLATWFAGADRWKTGAYFASGLVVSLVLLGGFAWGLLAACRALLRRMGTAMSSTVRHGVANLYRPGNQATAVLVSLGVGVMFTLTIFLIQRGMLDQMLASAPPDMPNVFVINVTSRERPGVEELLRTWPGIEGAPEIVPTLSARLTSVDGTPIEQRRIEGGPRRFNTARAVTYSSRPRPNADVIEGAWWAERNPAPNRVCVVDHTARSLGVKPGSRLEWAVGVQSVKAEVACVFRIEEVRMGANMDFVFSPGTLDQLPLQYFAALRVRPAEVAAFQRASFQRFPSVTVINGADVVEILQQVVDQIAVVVRFVSIFSILAGVIILASSVAATRFRRVREVAILKTLGATRRRIAAIFSIEFLILGAAAGLLGGLLATAFSNVLLVRVLSAKARLDWMPALASIALCALIANAAGWLASHRILAHRPLDILRHE